MVAQERSCLASRNTGDRLGGATLSITVDKVEVTSLCVLGFKE
jgi:hypothetical protein